MFVYSSIMYSCHQYRMPPRADTAPALVESKTKAVPGAGPESLAMTRTAENECPSALTAFPCGEGCEGYQLTKYL